MCLDGGKSRIFGRIAGIVAYIGGGRYLHGGRSHGSFFSGRSLGATLRGRGAGVEKCYVVAAKRAGEPTTVQTEGVNLEVLWEHDDLVDTTRVSTNDVAATLRTLGVEAARTTIVREVVGLFDAYGIAVNSRHLNLIADFMTQQVRPL